MIERIGICDWGIGGIGLYQKIKERVSIPIVYLSDAGFTPYGKVDEINLQKRWDEVVSFFEKHKIGHIAVACNALSTVVEPNPQYKTVISSGIELVSSLNLPTVGITGGYRTIESEVYKKPLEQRGIKVVHAVGQALSAQIEKGDLDSAETLENIIKIFSQLKNESSVLLACTHYPVLKEQILTLFPSFDLLDPAEHMANDVITAWRLEAKEGSDEWYTTSDPEQMKKTALACFDQRIDEIKRIIL